MHREMGHENEVSTMCVAWKNRPESVFAEEYPDELPVGYCQHGMRHLPFGVSYDVAAQKILSKND